MEEEKRDREKDGDRRRGDTGRDGRGGKPRGARDDPNHVAIYLSRESGHYRVKFGFGAIDGSWFSRDQTRRLSLARDRNVPRAKRAGMREMFRELTSVSRLS